MKTLIWEELKSDLDFEDRCDELQEWEVEKILIDTDLVYFGLKFYISKRINSKYRLYVFYSAKTGLGPLFMQIHNLGSLEEAQEKAEEILQIFEKR